MTDFTDGPVAIVGGHRDQDGGAARPITFKYNFVDLPTLEFASAAHDGALDVFGGHADRFSGGDGGAQTRIHARIAALPGGNHYFFYDAREGFPALGVQSGLFVLDGRPF